MKRVQSLSMVFTGAALLLLAGCTSRGLTITSNPPGAEVTINHRSVGETPVHVGFTHYGVYRIELRKERFEVLTREEKINPPPYGYDPVTFAADNLVPARLNDEAYFHYVLKPLKDGGDDRTALLDRAELARNGTVTHPGTGEQMQIALSKQPKPPVTTAEAGPAVTGTKPTIGELKGIEATKPEGPRIARELGLLPNQPEKTPKPEVVKPGKKDSRVPVSEELIFDKPSREAPAPKKVEPKK